MASCEIQATEIPGAEARLYEALSALFDARAGERVKTALVCGWITEEDALELLDLLGLSDGE